MLGAQLFPYAQKQARVRDLYGGVNGTALCSLVLDLLVVKYFTGTRYYKYKCIYMPTRREETHRETTQREREREREWCCCCARGRCVIYPKTAQGAPQDRATTFALHPPVPHGHTVRSSSAEAVRGTLGIASDYHVLRHCSDNAERIKRHVIQCRRIRAYWQRCR